MQEAVTKILMVDDVTRYQHLYEFAIKDAINAEVSFATNGLEALEKLSNAENYHLLVLDLNMPKLGGEETLKKIRQDTNLDNLPVAILTGDSSDETQQRLLDLGADDFIEKGSSPEVFVARLKSLIRHKKTIDRLTTMAMDMDIFAAGVLHDIRNLETNIVSICHITRLLLEDDPLKNKDKIKDEIKSLDKQAERIGSYAQEIIQMVRETQTNVEIKPQDMGAIIAWAKKLLVTTKENQTQSRNITWQEPEAYLTINADKKFLKIALLNIFQNSIKYTPIDQDIQIEITQSRQESVDKLENDRIITRIRDHGIGIPDDELRNVFKPFTKGHSSNQKVDNHGFGLGLSLVVKVISAMKGKVWAEAPESGDGIVICIELAANNKQQVTA